ncbi:PLP-dependent aminotransferase family protein [Planctomycetales bacterium ZRK34]|nr:PLP-dependent aminotransferase family protein [Planctomycetales bacterium ZRK34]
MIANSTPSFHFSQRAARTVEQPIGYLMAQAVDNPDVISLAAGLVDYPTLPSETASKLLGDILNDPKRSKIALQYGTTEGLGDLRRMLLEHIASLDEVKVTELDASPDDVVITTGSQQSLFILTDLLVDPGDIVITAWPSYFVYTGALASFGARVRSVEMDEQGMVPESLERVLGEIAEAGELERVKIVYVCSYHQNPTGLTLAESRRPRVLDIVKRYSRGHRILLLEDAAYRELTYAGTAPPSIKRWDTENRYVALAQTFSKPFAPGLKTGYVLLPRDLVEPMLLQKGSHDFGSVNLVQHLLAEAIRQGVYAEHVQMLCDHYTHKRDAMLEALDEHLGDFEPGQTRWTHPTGGLYVWLTLPSRLDTGRGSKLFDQAISEGVLYVPGAFCYPADSARTAPCHHMRLSFGTAGIDQIREGVKRLGRAIRAVGGDQ